MNLALAKFRFIHCTDFHESHRNIAHSYTRIQQIKKQTGDDRDLVTSYCGDTQTGANDDSFALNAWLDKFFKFDVKALGNHETYVSPKVFSVELQKLKETSHGIFKPYLASNLDMTRIPDESYQALLDSGIINTKPFIKETKNGKLGFLAVLPRASSMQAHSFALDDDQTKNLIARQADQLKKDGCDLVVLLSHRGYNWDKELAQTQSVKDIDMIIGGDSHTPISGLTEGQTLFNKENGEQILLVNSGANAEYLGLVDVSKDTNGKLQFEQSTLISSRNDDNCGLEEHASKNFGIVSKVKGALGENIFDVLTHLEREEENSLHERLNQMHYYAALRQKAAKADIGAISSLELKRYIRNAVDRDDLKLALPYNNQLLKAEYSGNELIKLVNDSYESFKKARPFMLFSSLRHKICDGEVSDVEIETSPGIWQAIDTDKKYSLATWDFLMSDKSMFDTLKKENDDCDLIKDASLQFLLAKDLVDNEVKFFPRNTDAAWLYESYDQWRADLMDQFSSALDADSSHGVDRTLRRMS